MKRICSRKWLSLLLCLSLLCVLLCSCAKGMDNEAMPGAPSTDVMEDAESSLSGGSVDKSEIGDSMQNESNEENSEEGLEPKIIKTADINAETKQFDTAMTEIEKAVKAMGGYVESSSVRGQNYYSQHGGSRYAEYTIRIPAEKLDAFMESAGNLVHVTNSSTSATDVSNEYYDIEARLSVLETERQVLEKMLSQSTSVSNMITIEQRLYDVIYEIESYKTMLKVYDSKVAYSTVRMTVSEVVDLTVIQEDNTFGSRFKAAFKESWQDFADFCKDFVIGFVYAFPTLMVLAAIAAIITLSIVLPIRKKRKKKQAEAKQDQAKITE